MKLFTDMSTDISGEVELNEASSEKTYVIKGIFSSPGVKNRNGRVYPMHIWEDNVARYQEEIKNNSINTLAELEHPPRSTVNPWEAVAKTRLLEMRDGKVYGEMEILNNGSKETNQLKALIDAGVSIGVSTRGVGRLGKGQLVEEYQLITTDIVSNPSDYGANLQGFSESLIMEGVDFSIEENGKIVCTPAGCSLQESEEIDENEEKIEKPETECSKKAKALTEALIKFASEPEQETESYKLAKSLFEAKFSVNDIKKVIKKNKGYATVQDKDGNNITLDNYSLENIDGDTIFGMDQDGEEIELKLKDITLLEAELNEADYRNIKQVLGFCEMAMKGQLNGRNDWIEKYGKAAYNYLKSAIKDQKIK